MVATRAEEARQLRSVLVIDDQRTFADLLGTALEAQPDLRAIEVAYDLTTGIELVRRHRPDVVVLDVLFEGDSRDGVDVAREIRAVHPDGRIVLLSGWSEPSLVGRAAAAGANAVIAKNGSLDQVLAAVRAVGSGFTVDILMLQHAAVPDHMPTGPTLTPRETDVLGMLALGLDARTIGAHLDISLNTCRTYIKTLLGKFGAHSQLECVATARRLGYFGESSGRSGSAG